MMAAKLIHKTYASFLSTVFPVHYYGFPDGKICILFSRFYKKECGGSGIEFVYAVHKDFNFDYNNEVITSKNKTDKTPVFAETIDNADSKYEIIRTCREVTSYAEAIKQLTFVNTEIVFINQIAANVG
jgi:hypothetical protein